MSFLLSLIFSLQKNQRRGQNRLCLEAEGGGMVYTHVGKCKNDKIKGVKKKILNIYN
jgi:hypothetical protein